MKISQIIAGILLAGTLCPQPVRAEIYTDKINGFSIDLPNGWKTKSDPIVNLVAAPADQINKPNPFPNIKIVARSLPGGQTLDNLCDTSKRQWSALWTVESDQHAKTGKTPTRRLVLMQIIPAANASSKVLKAFATGNDNYYIVSCAEKPERFEQLRKSFEATVDSLTLNKK